MRKNVIGYYVLLMLLVMGAFAAMALNSYGILLMSYVALGFGIVFLFELLLLLPKEEEMTKFYKGSLALELLALSGLCILYSLRGISVEIPYSLLLKFVLFALLFAVNVYHSIRAWHYAKATPLKVKGNITLYFVALLLYIAGNYLPESGTWVFIALALACQLSFAVFGWWKGRVIINGEETSAWKKVIQFRNKSGIQLIFFTLASLYFVLNSAHLLPPLYNGSLPNGYAKVVNEWQQDKTKTNPTEFEAAYKKFLEGKN
ncbi:MAG: hypothetical protein JSU09_05990 [Bacteroidetes bacterium]|nr:hypothetical protein [Bacteroidota bacterium]